MNNVKAKIDEILSFVKSRTDIDWMTSALLELELQDLAELITSGNEPVTGKVTRKTKVVSAFPACGKTYLFNHLKCSPCFKAIDSASSEFSWIYTDDGKERNPDFPRNYIEHIKENIGKYDLIFVSSHKQVRDALKEAGIEYTLVYPDRSLKEEWLGRCWIRQNQGTQGFPLDVLNLFWEEWIDECEEDAKNRESIVLQHGEYLYQYGGVLLDIKYPV